jgi:hypothetical protein
MKLDNMIYDENEYSKINSDKDRFDYLKSNLPNLDSSKNGGHSVNFLNEIAWTAPTSKQAIDIIKSVVEKVEDNRILLSLAYELDAKKRYANGIPALKKQLDQIVSWLNRTMPENAHFTGGTFQEKYSKYEIAKRKLQEKQKMSGVVLAEKKQELEEEKRGVQELYLQAVYGKSAA